MQQVNPSHERQKSTRDKTERKTRQEIRRRGQILVIVCLFTEHLRQERVYKKYSATLGMIQSVLVHKNSVFSENSSFF